MYEDIKLQGKLQAKTTMYVLRYMFCVYSGEMFGKKDFRERERERERRMEEPFSSDEKENPLIIFHHILDNRRKLISIL